MQHCCHLDDGVVTLWLDGQNGTCGHATNFLVVKRDVRHARRFEKAVISNDGDFLLGGLVHGRQDGVFVFAQDDQHFGALGDQAVDVSQLFLGRCTCVGHDVFGT